MVMIGNAYSYTLPHSHIPGFMLREAELELFAYCGDSCCGSGIIKMAEVLKVDLGLKRNICRPLDSRCIFERFERQMPHSRSSFLSVS